MFIFKPLKKWQKINQKKKVMNKKVKKIWSFYKCLLKSLTATFFGETFLEIFHQF
jgi:hypothetical protein